MSYLKLGMTVPTNYILPGHVGARGGLIGNSV